MDNTEQGSLQKSLLDLEDENRLLKAKIEQYEADFLANLKADIFDQLTQLKERSNKIADQLKAYAPIAEDVWGLRVFEKAKSYLVNWITLGGITAVIAGSALFFGAWKYAVDLIDTKVKTLSEQQVKETLQKETAGQVAKYFEAHSTEISRSFEQATQQYVQLEITKVNFNNLSVKTRILEIENVLETGSKEPDYSQANYLPDDPGHLTYGRGQTTLASGNLFLLIRAYIAGAGANSEFGDKFKAYLDRLQARDLTLDYNNDFRQLLSRAGKDPVMQRIQDQFFERIYFEPALTAAQALRIRYPLGLAVVYDSIVSGSFSLIRDRVNVKLYGSSATPPSGIDEKEWIKEYVSDRRSWMETNPNSLLRLGVYRMDVFKLLIDSENWGLVAPIIVRGVALD